MREISTTSPTVLIGQRWSDDDALDLAIKWQEASGGKTTCDLVAATALIVLANAIAQMPGHERETYLRDVMAALPPAVAAVIKSYGRRGPLSSGIAGGHRGGVL